MISFRLEVLALIR